MRAFALVLLLTGAAAAQSSPPPAASSTGEDALRRELDHLRTRQRALERRLDASEARTAAERAGPRFAIGRDGLVFGSADGTNQVRLHAVVHLDGRAYVGGAHPIPDTFLVRRARASLEGTLAGIVGFKLMADFAQTPSPLQDAYVELRPWRWLGLRAGRFRSPVGLEWLEHDTTMPFVERSLATDLVPLREIGLMLTGDVGRGTFTYALALVNGAPDGGNAPELDPQSDKEYVGRVFLRPLRPFRRAAITDLGIGVAASFGRVAATAATGNLPAYRSTGQQPIFAYADGAALLPAAATANAAPLATDAAVAAGDRWRLSPQLYWYAGPVGLLGELVVSSQRVARLGLAADLRNIAWNLTATFVMTLERASYDGFVPKHPVDFRHRRFGALELALRYSELRIDAAAFPQFANPATAVRSARELAADLNWHLTQHLKLMLSFHRTTFAGGAPVGGDREPELAFIGRIQAAL